MRRNLGCEADGYNVLSAVQVLRVCAAAPTGGDTKEALIHVKTYYEAIPGLRLE